MFRKYISVPVFLISLAVGLLFVYISSPDYTKILVYPTPDNEDKVEYVDKANNCFIFKHKKVDCPDDLSQIKQIPMQN